MGIGTTLTALLEARGLDAPSGQPLYAYRLSSEEYAELEGAVAENTRRRRIPNRRAAGGIALLAAERFCREHSGGPWKWETALGEGPSQALRAALVDAIAHYWKRPLLSNAGGQQLLWTLAREGGLPRQLLAREGVHISGVLRGALADRESLSEDVETITLVTDRMHLLPASLQAGEVVAQLLADVVDAVSRLRSRVPDVVAHDRPLSLLEGAGQDWRAELPLNVEDAVARQLVAGLVAQRAARSIAAFEVVSRIRPFGDGWAVIREIDLPRRVPLSAVQQQFGGFDGNRAELVLVADDDLTATVAELRLSGDGKFYRVEQRKRPTIRLDRQVGLTVRDGDALQHDADPEGGAPLGDGPWVFSESDDGLSLGEGSVSTRAEAVLVAWPAEHRVEVDGELEHLGQIDGLPGEVRHIGRLRGHLSCCPPHSEMGYRVRTRTPGHRAAYSLSARAFRRVGGTGTRVLVGTPSVFESHDGFRHRLDVPVEFAPLGSPGNWRPLNGCAVGEMWLRVVHEDELRIRQRVLRLPEPSRIEVAALPGQGRGRLAIVGLDGSVDLEAMPGVVVTTSACEGRRQFDLAVDGEPPETLRFRVENPAAPGFWIEAPFPTRRVEVVDLKRNRVERGTTVAVDRLLGIRIRALDPDPRADFALEGRCTSAGLAWRRIGDLRTEAGGWLSLALDEVEPAIRLMLSGGQLDALVELRVVRMGGRSTPTLLAVSQYPRTLGVDREDAGRPTCVARPEGDSTELRVELRPLVEPAARPFVLEGVEGGWTWPAEAGAGRWLVTAWEDLPSGESVCGARPRLVTVLLEGHEAPLCESPLLAAASIRDQDDRAEALRLALDRLCADARHTDWSIVDQHIDTLGQLPAHTFDVVVALSRHPVGACMAAMRRALAGRLAEFAHALETLPFAWWLVPPSAWRRAFEAVWKKFGADLEDLADCFGDDLPPEQVFAMADPAGQTKRIRRAFTDVGGVFGALAIWLEACEGVDPNRWAQTALVAPLIIDDRLKALTRQTANRRWPRFSPDHDLERWVEILELDHSLLRTIAPTPQARWHEDVVVAPALAALAAAHRRPIDVSDLLELRRLRAFDSEWFDEAWNFSLVRLWAEPASRQLFTKESTR